MEKRCVSCHFSAAAKHSLQKQWPNLHIKASVAFIVILTLFNGRVLKLCTVGHVIAGQGSMTWAEPPTANQILLID